jgi:hypothetical protein
MLLGEDFGYLKDKEQNNFAVIVKKALLLGAVLLSIFCFVYITISAYYFVYHDKNSDIKVIKSPPEPIKIVQRSNGSDIKDIDKTIYDSVVGNPALIKENINNIIVIEQVKTPLVKKNDINLSKYSAEDVGDRPKISNSAIVINDKDIKSTNKMIIYDGENVSSDLVINDLSLTSINTLDNNTKNIVIKNSSRVQIAALTSRNSAVKYWSELTKSYPDLFANLDNFISEANLGEKGTFYRLQIGNFKSQVEAENFCHRFISQIGQSKENCMVVE